jgi:ElaB/YqjD/DUF883 family membrane-anchored ribosome-binding protein
MPAHAITKRVAIKDSFDGMATVRSILTNAMQDSVSSASRVLKRGRHAVEDAIDEVKRSIRHRPFQAVGSAVAVGGLTGILLTWIASRRR